MQVSCETTPNSGAEGSWAEQLLDCVSGTEAFHQHCLAKLHCANRTITLLASRSPSLCLMNLGPRLYRNITRTGWLLPH